ncbi:aspartate ammonia-lyase [Haloactinomyces albus]|uniref:Aspartate ammonia-lyase n=1 Tax=Haloactinomyces albus TaxID=1352928 RepID=A0AAE4CQ02_9ACTN|nr:aspartate ammonia-lyase [Haloactinomyces albus]MDR7303597.1 aspartate ammonia-lyase [Haloactinomyces albus]
MSGRNEHDLLGDFEVPDDVYYGVHTARALENFPISGMPIASWPDLVAALACVKQAAALANRDLGLLPESKADAIVKACDDIRTGWGHDQFVVDVIQGGAGTSTNMNANEVIANRALELLGHDLGDYRYLHPLEEVNLGQSTNDVYPTAARVALQWSIRRLLSAVQMVREAFAAKGVEFAAVTKIGRTQLQDAVPMTLGQEFDAFASLIEKDRRRLLESRASLAEVNLGGTAIGTGLNAHPDYATLACGHLAKITGLDVQSDANPVAATQDTSCFVQISTALKRFVVNLSKMCNDLRLLSSGPRAGLGEIALPAVQAGSSIMPGKVNPVIPEVVNQVAFEVIGQDTTITMAAEAGQLQLNAFEPIIVHSLFTGMARLTAACNVLAKRSIAGITAEADSLRASVEHSISLITAVNQQIGYTEATAIAQEALATNRGVVEIIAERGLLSPDELTELLDPNRITGVAVGTARAAGAEGSRAR